MAGFAKVIVDLTWHVSIRCMARPKYENKAKYSTEEATARPIYASTRLFTWEDPMGYPTRHGASGVEQNMNYGDLCSKNALRGPPRSHRQQRPARCND